MSYDRDIRFGKVILWCLAAGNLVALGINLRAHNWVIAFACGIWLCNVLAQVAMLKTQQEARDRARVIEAVLSPMRDEIETGEY